MLGAARTRKSAQRRAPRRWRGPVLAASLLALASGAVGPARSAIADAPLPSPRGPETLAPLPEISTPPGVACVQPVSPGSSAAFGAVNRDGTVFGGGTGILVDGVLRPGTGVAGALGISPVAVWARSNVQITPDDTNLGTDYYRYDLAAATWSRVTLPGQGGAAMPIDSDEALGFAARSEFLARLLPLVALPDYGASLGKHVVLLDLRTGALAILDDDILPKPAGTQVIGMSDDGRFIGLSEDTTGWVYDRVTHQTDVIDYPTGVALYREFAMDGEGRMHYTEARLDTGATTWYRFDPRTDVTEQRPIAQDMRLLGALSPNGRYLATVPLNEQNQQPRWHDWNGADEWAYGTIVALLDDGRMVEDDRTVAGFSYVMPGLPTYKDPLSNANCTLSANDWDGDGIPDEIDFCQSTEAAVTVDQFGCTAGDMDTDADGHHDFVDSCSGSPADELPADTNGCTVSQRDTDHDTVNDAADHCPQTPAGEAADLFGCSDSERDQDGDGVVDVIDLCFGTPSASAVDASGCVVKAQLMVATNAARTAGLRQLHRASFGPGTSAFAFVTPRATGPKVLNVTFWLDGSMLRKDTAAPFDLAGAMSSKVAYGLPIDLLAPGAHRVRAVVTYKGGSTETLLADVISTGVGPRRIEYSAAQTRVVLAPLAGAKVQGKIAVLLAPALKSIPDLSSVVFRLDGRSTNTDKKVPYDAKSSSTAKATLLNTATMKPGSHTMTADVKLKGGFVIRYSATFTI